MEATKPERPINELDQHFLVKLPNDNMLIAERIQPVPKQRVVCYHCKIILEFISGPTLVKCS